MQSDENVIDLMHEIELLFFSPQVVIKSMKVINLNVGKNNWKESHNYVYVWLSKRKRIFPLGSLPNHAIVLVLSLT